MADQYGPPPLELDPARQRRRVCVVVRSADPARRQRQYSGLPPDVPCDRRRRLPTLIGLGQPDRRTLPDFSLQCDEPGYPKESSPRLSRPVVLREGVDDELARAHRVEGEPPDFSLQCDGPGYPKESSPRLSRPVVLREGVDDELAHAYRVEAARILASGVFSRPHHPRLKPDEVEIAARRELG